MGCGRLYTKKRKGRDGDWFTVHGEWPREVGKEVKIRLFNSLNYVLSARTAGTHL